MLVAAGVGLAGAAGALCRYEVEAMARRWSGDPFPFGTLLVNLFGSFVLGLLIGLSWYHGLGGPLSTVIGVGGCGGLTTWSTASWEAVRLLGDGMPGRAALIGLGGLTGACLAAACGMAIAGLL
jgi:CrcB protein